MRRIHPTRIFSGQKAVGASWSAGPRMTFAIMEIFQRSPVRILLPRLDGASKEAVFVNTAGGIAGGDRLEFSATALGSASTAISSQAAEKVYRALSESVTTYADGQPKSRDSVQLYQRSNASCQRNSWSETADYRIQLQAAHGGVTYISAAGESSQIRPNRTDSWLSRRLSASGVRLNAVCATAGSWALWPQTLWNSGSMLALSGVMDGVGHFSKLTHLTSR